MAKSLTEDSKWERSIYQLDKDTPVLGGPGGPDNRQAQQLANRTLYLHNLITSMPDYREYTFFISDNDPHGTIAGLSATTNGQLFRVAQGTPSRSSFIYYKNNGGTPEVITTMPSQQVEVEVYEHMLESVDSFFSPRQLPTNDDTRIAWGITDNKNNVGMALYTDSSFLSSAGHAKQSRYNNHDLAWALTDDTENIGIGLRNNGGAIIAGDDFDVLSDNNNLNIDWGITDSTGRVAMGIRDGKLVYFEQTGSSTFERDGDIYRVRGNSVTRLTHTGNNFSPSVLPDGRVSFLSTRQRDQVMEYVADESGTQRLYRDNVKFDQVVITGQSLAQGGSNAAITIVPPSPRAWRFANGPVGDSSHSEVINRSLAPLREEVYETISTGFGRQLLAYDPDATLLMSGQAKGGSTYATLKKGGSTGVYEACIEQVTYGHDQAGGAVIKALLLIHGEADGNSGNTQYEKDLTEWLNDFTTDIKAVNGQSTEPVILLCQVSSASGYKKTENRDIFQTPFAQLAASENNPRIFLIGPKYFYDYNDYAHINAVATRTLGEYYAKVYCRVVIQGEDWRPVSPSAITVSGNDVVIDFHVPAPPLFFDTETVTDPGNYGFDLKNSGNVSINSVTLTGDKQVTLSLSAKLPDGAVLAYAFYNGVYPSSGRTAGARGCLRDSDDYQGIYSGSALHNWCVTFKHIF